MKLYPVILLVFLTFSLRAQNSQIVKGLVRDADSGEPLEAVSILCKECAIGTTTDSLGRFELGIEMDGSVHLNFSYIGYESRTLFLHTQRNGISLNVNLKRQANELMEVVITDEASGKDQLSNVDLGNDFLTDREVRELPSVLGETDVLKTFQLKPGVHSGSEGSTALFIRGGEGDQNLILLDDIPIYNPSHLLGFVSTFNSEILQSAKIYKAGFPSSYGGRVSSVVDIETRAPNDKHFGISGGLGLITANLTLESPLKKNHTSVFVSGRRTHVDYLADAVDRNFNIGERLDQMPDYYFYDINFKLKSKLSKKDRIEISGYSGRDRFATMYEVHDIDLDWGNSLGSIQWNHQISDQLFINSTGYFTEFSHNLLNRIDPFDFALGSKIQNYGGK